MMKKTLCFFSVMLLNHVGYTQAPPLFYAVSGRSLSVPVSVCLNAITELSCFSIPVTNEFIALQTTTPGYMYSLSGVKVTAPGWAIQLGSSLCALLSNDYCLVPLSSDHPVTITLSPTSSTNSFMIGGEVLGLNSDGLVLEDTVNQQSLSLPSGAHSFLFSQPIYAGSQYDVVVAAQPQGSHCVVFNPTGTANAIVSNISVACGVPTAVAGTQSGHVALSFDEGATWPLSTTPSPKQNASVNGVFATNDNASLNGLLYAASSDGMVYSSENLGLTWTALSTPIDSTSVNGLFVVAGSADTIYAVTQGGTFASAVNDGSGWTTTHPGLGALYSVFYNETTMQFVIGAAGITYTSPLTSMVWTPGVSMPTAPHPVTSVALTNQNNVYALANQTMYQYASGAWHEFAQTLEAFYFNPLNSNLYAGSAVGWVFQLNAPNALNQLGFVDYNLISALYFFD